MSRLRIAALFAARSHGNPEAKAHEQNQSLRAVYVSEMPCSGGGRHLRDTAREGQRLDKWLWFARFAKSRSLAAKLIEEGCIRVNRQRAVKPSTTVKCGDVLTMRLHGRIRVIEIRAAGGRRGPASEAQALYSEVLLHGTVPGGEDSEE